MLWRHGVAGICTPPNPGRERNSMSKVEEAKGRVDSALSRLEKMVDERLRAETTRADELAARFDRLERQHQELKKVATDVEAKLERAMSYIKSLLAQDQK